MHLQDRLTIDEKRRTRDGYMTVNARVAKAGNVQLYSGAEVDPDNSHGMRDKAVVRVSMLLADAGAIQAVEDGTRELSMGYDCQLDFTAGTSPSGEAYDAVQRNIRSNHIAVVPRARGGSDLRIGDSMPDKTLETMNDAEITAMRDSVRGMPLSTAKDLPIYDAFKGFWTDGRPANEMRALYDGAVDGVSPGSDQVSRVEATRDHMIDSMRNEHRRPVNDNNPHGDVA
ncbi:hypothetical protein FHX11_003925 [Rhizobium sp. BK602]|nr:hypothetical protein [Rhizobium sp. BK602]